MNIIKYAPIKNWLEISGMNRSATYNALAAGHLRAVKLGRRTLIDVPHGLDWMASLPSVQVTVGKKAA